MAKTILRNDDSDFEFLLIGIVSSYRDFRVCREINRTLEIELERADDLTVVDKKRQSEAAFAFFEFTTATEDRFVFVSNKTENGMLLAERKEFDYLLVIQPGMTSFDVTELVQRLKPITIIQASYAIEVMELKSKENLLF